VELRLPRRTANVARLAILILRSWQLLRHLLDGKQTKQAPVREVRLAPETSTVTCNATRFEPN